MAFILLGHDPQSKTKEPMYVNDLPSMTQLVSRVKSKSNAARNIIYRNVFALGAS